MNRTRWLVDNIYSHASCFVFLLIWPIFRKSEKKLSPKSVKMLKVDIEADYNKVNIEADNDNKTHTENVSYCLDD